MTKIKLVYMMSLRNAAADRAGRHIEYKGETRYMKSPLEFLVEQLNASPLGDLYSLEGVIFDDDEGLSRDCEKLSGYGFRHAPGEQWIHPSGLAVQGVPLASLFHSVPSSYRRLAVDAAAERALQKRVFERRLLDKLHALDADFVVLDGLLVILDELVRPGAEFCRRIANIHPGVTRLGSPFERRGAFATLDALYGARGQRVVDWSTMRVVPAPVIDRTGASFHYVDKGIDSGEVVFDVLGTSIDPSDSILELRWNNFQRSLFPALEGGLLAMAESLVD
jgi:folate-dependent phosphoribosylglycinamide formyltransferase PurN